eukprot:Skav201708  [mRNA]  locus=scaffold311:58856:65685:+ [translate_table: standard]
MLFVRRTGHKSTELDSGCKGWKVKPAPVESELRSGPVSGFVDFCSALHLAAAEANVEDLRKLLKGTSGTSGSGISEDTSEDADAKDAKPVLCDVNAVDAWDETALHMAARRGSIEACELLIEAKADVNALNANDETPLRVTGSVSLCHLLLQHGGHLGVPVPEDAVPHSCTTALMESLHYHLRSNDKTLLTAKPFESGFDIFVPSDEVRMDVELPELRQETVRGKQQKTLTLDFRGRCSMASAKNFQLEAKTKHQVHYRAPTQCLNSCNDSCRQRMMSLVTLPEVLHDCNFMASAFRSQAENDSSQVVLLFGKVHQGAIRPYDLPAHVRAYKNIFIYLVVRICE